MTSSEYRCQITKQPFLVSDQEADAYGRFELPSPTVSPEERIRRLLAFRNAGKYFWRTSIQTEERVLSSYASGIPFPVAASSDELCGRFDPKTFGRPFDLSVSFFQQLYGLWAAVPRPAVSCCELEDCVAVQNSYRAARCVLVSNSVEVERCMYSDSLYDCSDCCDSLFLRHSSGCLECINCRYCQNLCYSEHCTYCSDSWFLSGCEDCRNCVFCVNLSGASYCIFNKQVSQSEYEEFIRSLMLNTRNGLDAAIERFSAFAKDHPEPHIYGEPAETISGNYLYDCRDVFGSFECDHAANLIGCCSLVSADTCIEGCGFGAELRNCAQFVSVGLNAHHVVNSLNCFNNVRYLTYCIDCTESANCFGCVGLNGAEYCILNQPYTKQAYVETVKKIRAALEATSQWGCFFTYAFSSYAYNNSAAAPYMPVTKVQASVIHLLWDESDEEVKPSELLGDLGSAGAGRYSEPIASLEDVLQSDKQQLVLLCELSGRPFQIRREEVQMYQHWKVVPPNRCFEERQTRRVNRLTPRKLGRLIEFEGQQLESSFPERWNRDVVAHDKWRVLVDENSRRALRS